MLLREMTYDCKQQPDEECVVNMCKAAWQGSVVRPFPPCGVCVDLRILGVSVCTRPAACELGARGSLLDAHLAHDVYLYVT